jgi:hypothetical protein
MLMFSTEYDRIFCGSAAYIHVGKNLIKRTFRLTKKNKILCGRVLGVTHTPFGITVKHKKWFKTTTFDKRPRIRGGIQTTTHPRRNCRAPKSKAGRRRHSSMAEAAPVPVELRSTMRFCAHINACARIPNPSDLCKWG